ncbi:LPO_1073/Vpar_1526 family protein [Bacillus mycoides]|uniref:LPO_1073/Vpar_1526 family protein n=1 Tax=Bacillus mycoides TaxID=1405 RepID=UPI000864270A|nr:LPO_1073/Vpar_1526 family protein [Bacillus mycoides]SCM90406.1 Uncharacterized protein BWAI21_05922 [Bacillus mycoides]
MNDKQEIIAGNHSNNVQGSKVIVNQYGLSYTEVERAAMNIFKSNFYDLGEKVDKLINERAEEIINRYLTKLKETSPEAIVNTQDPDLRFVIYETQKNHARHGDNDIADLLVDVLVNRTIENDKPFSKLVNNEALEIIPKLTLKQIDTITVIFLLLHVNIGSLFSIENLCQTLKHFVNDIPDDEFFYQHLQYTGCISISIGEVTFNKIMSTAYPSKFTDDNNGLIFEGNLMSVDPWLWTFSQKWKRTKLCNSALTSVAIAIAISNLKLKTGMNLSLSNWIKG